MSTEQPKPMPTPEEAIAAGALVVEGAQEPMSEREQKMLDTGSANPLLSGPRQTGFVPNPNTGGGTMHYVDADGAKIVRNVGPARPRRDVSAAEFHVDAGVGTDGEKAKVAALRGERKPSGGSASRLLGKVGLRR